MNIDDMLKAKARAILEDFNNGEQIFESPVAYAVTGDREELEKLAGVDFTKLKLVIHEMSAPEQSLEWVETTKTDDGIAICFDAVSEHPYEPEDAWALSQYVN